MKPHEAAAVGLFWLILADLDLAPENVALTETDGHFRASVTVLVRDDFEIPLWRVRQFLTAFAGLSRLKFQLVSVEEVPAPQPCCHFLTLTIAL